jgi:hypothetical protein
MTCKCGSERIANVNGKCSDMCHINVNHLDDIDYAGYVPSIGIGSGDYMRFSFCLDCGQIQKFKPVTDEELQEALE